MDTKTLENRISDLTSSLGDPTRRAIYISVRDSSEPMTTSMVANLFDIHPNVARHHLDRLTEDGYLRVGSGRRAGSGLVGAGRPAKAYEATEKEVSVHFAPQRFEMLVELLMRVLDHVSADDLSAVAEEIGFQYGKEIAAEIGPQGDAGYDEAVTSVARAMTGLGFAVDPDVSGQQLLTTHCPFGEAATNHPEVVCSLDRGIVSGLFGALSVPCKPVLIPHTHLDDDCITKVPVTLGSKG
jgi:predicted ArsR family transcriptional regulator